MNRSCTLSDIMGGSGFFLLILKDTRYIIEVEKRPGNGENIPLFVSEISSDTRF
jgi:hypothetical protein